jgi:hypothetical protein
MQLEDVTKVTGDTELPYLPVEFLRAISSALEVLRCSMRRLGMLKGCTCMLSELNWCLRGRWRSGLGRDKLSSFSLFLWFLQKHSSVKANNQFVSLIPAETLVS